MKILFIADTQTKKSVPLEYLTAIGNYAVAKKPDIIVHAGDHWDMPSLSTYESKGSKYFEGLRYKDDIEAGKEGMVNLLTPIWNYNTLRKKNKEKQYKPRMVFTIGNHEQRIVKAVNTDPKLEGIIGLHDLELEKFGWEVYDFLEVCVIEGVHFSHYFYNPLTGKPWAGKAHTMLNNIGFSFVQGHRQGKDIAEKHLANGKTIRGLVLGSCYDHEEEYKGPQANAHFQGCAMLHEVKDGNYSLMEVSLNYLKSNWL